MDFILEEAIKKIKKNRTILLIFDLTFNQENWL